MKELLFLCHRIPYPPNKGDKIRSFHLLQHLASRFRVRLGCFVDDPADGRHLPELEKLCAQVVAVPLSPFWRKLFSLRALASGEPLSLPYYRHPKLAAWVESVRAEGGVAAALAFSSPMAGYLLGSQWRGIPRILDYVDVDSRKWAQYAENHPFPMGALYRREAGRLLAFEREVAARFDRGYFVSEAEADLFRGLAPEYADRIDWFENGVDSGYFSPERAYPDPYGPEERVILFTGAMDYPPNVDAVVWFGETIFPRVAAGLPLARFVIVGGRPDRAVRALARLPGIRVTGAVADVRPYLAHATLSVAPLRMAQGVQNKVLEAMAMDKPILVTPQALVGVGGCPGWRPLMASSEAKMAELALTVLAAADAAAFGRGGRACILSRFHWPTNLARFDRFLRDQGILDQAIRENFI